MNISVIIPNYNHAQFLKGRIESVLLQTFPNFEVIILDDFSSDNSCKIIEQYRNHPKVSHIVYNTQNSGSTFKQWGKGIELAKGEWIWVAESDDWADPSFLEEVIKFKEEGNVGVIYTNSRVVNSNGEELYPYFGANGANSDERYLLPFVMKGFEFIRTYLLHSNVIPNASSVLFKKSLFYRLDQSFKQFRINGDWFFWVEMLKRSDVAYIPSVLNYYRTHPQNVRNSTYLNGFFLSEFFEVQKHVCNILNLNSKERRELKYNMLYRLFFEKLCHQVNVPLKMLADCLKIINEISPGVVLPAIRTIVVIKLRKLVKI